MRRALASVVVLIAVVPASAEGRRSFSRALRCGPAGSARVSGALRATVHPYLRVARRRRVRAFATLHGNADLRVEASAGAACGLDAAPVTSWTMPPVRFLIGAVPVVVVPRVTVYVSAEARAVQPLAARVHGSMTATAGLRYDGRVRRIGRFSQSFAGESPTGRAHGTLAARLTPSLELLLYGQAGPRFDFGTGLQFDSGPPRRLAVPVELAAGLRLPGLVTGPVTVLSRTIPLPLRSAVAAPPEPPRERARIEWDTRADIDLHVWDAAGRHTWFRESGVPGALLSKDDTDGFGPEMVDADDPDLTYGVCDFDDRGAGPTTVTARFTGAARAGRTTTATLRGEGDSAVLSGDHSPPVGWCRPRH